jgi:DNA-binding transcriptional ArsR family regulator
MADRELQSPTAVRILSDLKRSSGGVSCTDLARRSDIRREVLYVLVRRLAKARLVRRKRDGRSVLYTVTAAGLIARERFARRAGLKP